MLAGCVYRDLITVVRECDLQALRCIEQIHISRLGIVVLHQIMSNWVSQIFLHLSLLLAQ